MPHLPLSAKKKGFCAGLMRIGNGDCDSLDTKKSAALPFSKAASFVHSQGLEPWTH